MFTIEMSFIYQDRQREKIKKSQPRAGKILFVRECVNLKKCDFSNIQEREINNTLQMLLALKLL